MKKLPAVFKIEFLLYLRNFYSFFFTFLFPPLMLLLYGSIYGNEPSALFNGAGAMDISVPAYTAMIVAVTGLMAFPLTLSEYKENNVYKRFDATPAGKGLVITAQILVNLVMTLAGFLFLLAVGAGMYHIRINGSFLPILGALLLSISSIFSLGFFFTAVARSVKTSNLLCYISYFLMLFLSGATIPKELFPACVKNVAVFLPLTHVVELLQRVFRGAAPTQYMVNIEVLILVLLICGFTGAWLYKRKSWS